MIKRNQLFTITSRIEADKLRIVANKYNLITFQNTQDVLNSFNPGLRYSECCLCVYVDFNKKMYFVGEDASKRGSSDRPHENTISEMFFATYLPQKK